ncbi:MAG: S8 family serine peptidase, partial [Pseudomonadota bacterium]
VPSVSPCAHENCRSWDLIGWPREAQALGQCDTTVSVGLVDTGINAEHEIVKDANLEVITLADTRLPASKAIHGTAVASLLVGGPDTRVPGLISDAEVIAVDAFSRKGDDERADLVSLLRGLDLLAGTDVRVVGLSLAGPDNVLLAETVAQIVGSEQIVLVAAAGNAGPRGLPAYPAAYDGVIAVTAVDSNARVYRQGQRGPHIELAAPGVNMLAATSIRGARLKTGTSFAVPFVTAAVAILLSENDALSAPQAAARLRQNARDLGAEGKDDIFGYGLLQADRIC